MQELHLNIWAVFAAGAAKFFMGGIWYSKALFAEPWKKLNGLKDAQLKKGMAQTMLLEFLGNVLMAYVLAHAIRYAQAQGIGQGMKVGFFIWLGFIATRSSQSYPFWRLKVRWPSIGKSPKKFCD